MGARVVSKGINNTNTSDSGPNATAIPLILQYVDVAGSNLLLPPANFNLGTTAPSSSSSSLTVSMRELDTLTETVGRKLTLMFGEQLNFVSGESARLLGECASREIVAHLWTKGITTTTAQDNEVESLVGQLVRAVSQIEGEDESGVLKERKVKEKVSNYLSKAKIVSGPAWEKMNGGAGWIKFGTEIPTSTGDKWTADGVFHRAGSVVEKGDGNGSFLFLSCFLCVVVC